MDSTNSDQKIHAAIAKLTGGISPAGLMVAWTDWITHNAVSPKRQQHLFKEMQRHLALGLIHNDTKENDPRFADPLWNLPPYCFYRNGFLAAQDWWHEAFQPLPGVDPKHQKAMDFYSRQALDMFCPANFPLTNPTVFDRAVRSCGQSVVNGWRNWLDDLASTLTGVSREHGSFEVGETIAVTPGDVVFRNRLVELLRYRPKSTKVEHPPIFIVPAWIMKYYILDLSPQNSLISFLVDQGFEVFCLSWKNPGSEDAELDLNDYLELGITEPLSWLSSEHDTKAVHAVGYCLGGTLLAIAAAAAAREGHDIFATLSLLASQTDFTDPGELGIFITEAQVAFLEDLMAEQGYLEAKQMAAAFQMLRPADLIWSRVTRHYLLGERTPINDLMAWNADATRMPARMHATYLRKLFLENALANRTYRVDGRRVSLTDIRAPIYCLATESDHVSPWTSVFKLLALTDTNVRFVLTNGGHNGGVLSEPGHACRHFRTLEKQEGTRFVGPDAWFEKETPTDGSWWPDWTTWLKAYSRQTKLSQIWSSLQKTPGSYVFD